MLVTSRKDAPDAIAAGSRSALGYTSSMEYVISARRLSAAAYPICPPHRITPVPPMPPLRHLVVKPDLRCTARCPTCKLRRDLHRSAQVEPQLTLDDWARILAHAAGLGVRQLDMSGGEPTLYAHLADLVRLGKRHGMKTQLNTNGSLLGRMDLEALVSSGLDRVMISLYSARPETHDAMRALPGLWDKATSAIRQAAGLHDRFPHLEIITQTLLCAENLLELPEILQLQLELGSQGTMLSYLEGNLTGEALLPQDLVEVFQGKVQPRLVAFATRLPFPVRLLARRQVRRLFSRRRLSLEEWSTAHYHDGPANCPIPREMALVLANGDVHPCNVVEYTHEPVMGNLLDQELPTLWQGEAWQAYRRHPPPHCCFCPMLDQVFVPLVNPSRTAVLAAVRRRLRL
jgi:pyrroloquinoline quinone biosynthesis protein E